MAIYNLILIAFTAVFSENIIFSHAIGTNVIIMAARKGKNFAGICFGVLYMSTISAVISYIVNVGIFKNSLPHAYLPLTYVLSLAVIYVITLLLAMIILKKRFATAKKYIHISVYNAVVMGAMYFSATNCSSFGEYLFFGIGSGIGFCLSALMLSAVYKDLTSKEVPRAFRGIPAIMIYFGILAMAFYGILGHSLSYI